MSAYSGHTGFIGMDAIAEIISDARWFTIPVGVVYLQDALHWWIDQLPEPNWILRDEIQLKIWAHDRALIYFAKDGGVEFMARYYAELKRQRHEEEEVEKLLEGC